MSLRIPAINPSSLPRSANAREVTMVSSFVALQAATHSCRLVVTGLPDASNCTDRSGSHYDIANREFVALGIQTAHPVRHACATRLLADGLTLKEIGDHLGHRSTS